MNAYHIFSSVASGDIDIQNTRIRGTTSSDNTVNIFWHTPTAGTAGIATRFSFRNSIIDVKFTGVTASPATCFLFSASSTYTNPVAVDLSGSSCILTDTAGTRTVTGLTVPSNSQYNTWHWLWNGGAIRLTPNTGGSQTDISWSQATADIKLANLVHAGNYAGTHTEKILFGDQRNTTFGAIGSGVVLSSSGLLSTGSVNLATQTTGAIDGTTQVSGVIPNANLCSGTHDATTFVRGDGACATPSGSGDVSSNTSASLDGEIVLFSGTTGKLIKRASGGGIAHVVSGQLMLNNVDLASEVTGFLPSTSVGTGVVDSTELNRLNGLTGTIVTTAAGTATLATALASTPSECLAGQAARGVAASGNAVYCFYPSRPPGRFTITSPTAAENDTLLQFPNAVTLTKIHLVMIGSGTPTITYTIKRGTDRTTSISDIVASNVFSAANCSTALTTGCDATLATTAIPANSFVWIVTTATSGTLNELHGEILYTEP